MNRKHSHNLDTARMMPPLRHKLDGQPFDLGASQVLKWIAAQPQLQAWLFERLRNRKLIVFDSAAQKWRGKDWKP
jgi:hypothetical protein